MRRHFSPAVGVPIALYFTGYSTKNPPFGGGRLVMLRRTIHNGSAVFILSALVHLPDRLGEKKEPSLPKFHSRYTII